MRIKALAFFACASCFIAHLSGAEASQQPLKNVKTANHAFFSGEKLTYVISWSNVLKAGTAVMEVKEEKTPEGRRVYGLTSTAKSAGIVSLDVRRVPVFMKSTIAIGSIVAALTEMKLEEETK
jgi:hypothetical protein